MTVTPIQDNLPLFVQARAPLARGRDETSQHSAQWIKSSGVMAAQERAVFECLKLHPGATSRELSRHLPFADRNVTSRRLASLLDQGHVHKSVKRRCAVSKMLCFTWYANAVATKIGTLSAQHPGRSRSGERDEGPIPTPGAGRPAEMMTLVCPSCGHRGQVRKPSDKPAQCSRCGTIIPPGSKPGEGAHQKSEAASPADRGVGREFSLSKNGESSPVQSSQTLENKACER